jgi:GNAT superfamily N-acetyltransferase
MDPMSPVWNLFDLAPDRARRERAGQRTRSARPYGEDVEIEIEGLEITDDPARIDVDLVHRELAASYWSPGVPRRVVEAAIAGSECWSAHRDGRQVGFARLVTDGATFGYLADVFVVAQARGAGVGKALVSTVVARADEYGLRRLVLATRDAHGVYRPFGFTDPPAGLLMERTADPAVLYGRSG